MLRSSKLVSNDSFDIRCSACIVAVAKDRSETSGNRSVLALGPYERTRDAVGLQSLVELFGELPVRRAIAEESTIAEALWKLACLLRRSARSREEHLSSIDRPAVLSMPSAMRWQSERRWLLRS